jgi:Ran GTPase-activating protein (RanGAP) involved in mRNA processing and transport
MEKENKMDYIKKIENNDITKLDLSWSGIDDNEAEEIAKALSNNTSLQELWLSINKIGDKGVEEIAKALYTNTSIQKLELSGNNIGDKGAEEIAKALSKNTSLQKLYLSFNNIGDKGAELIAKGLSKNTFLQNLNLYGISDSSLDKIDTLLERNYKLSKKKWMPIVFNIVLNFPKLPTYVLLDIVDTYPDYHILNQYQKVCFIDWVKNEILY